MAAISKSLTLLLLLAVLVPQLATAQEAEPAPSNRPVEKTRGWPLYSAEVWADGRTERDALFSLYHMSRDSRGHITWIAPFYFAGSTASKKQQWSLLFPLYYYRSSPESWRFWSLPLEMSGTESGSEFIWGAPGFMNLVKSSRVGDTKYMRAGVPIVFDIFGAMRRPELREYNLLTLMPNYHGGGSWSVFRYERDEQAKKTSSQLIPLYFHTVHGAKDSRSGRSLVVPLLYYKSWTPSSEYHLLGPIAGHYGKRAAGSYWSALFGLIASGRHNESRWTRMEPFFSHASGPGTSKFHILHLYGREVDENHGLSVQRFLDPLGRFESGPGYYKHRMLPFYMAGERGKEKYRYIVPFYAKKKTEASELTIAFPFYYDFESEKKSVRAFAPIYFETREGTLKNRVVFPLYYGVRSPERDLDIVAPLYWRSRTPKSEHWTAFPIYSQTKTEKSDLKLVLGPVYVGHTDKTTKVESHSVLWPFFQYRSGPEEKHFHALPFLWHTKRGSDLFSLIAPIYLRASDKDHDQHWILPVWGEYTRKAADGATHKRSFYGLGAVLSSERRNAEKKRVSSGLYVLGPVFQHKKQYVPEEETTTSLLWPFFSREKSKTRSHLHALPLAWFTRDGDKTLDVLAPLYVRKKDAHESRVWVFPTWYYARTPEERVTLLAPLYYEGRRYGVNKGWSRLVLGNLWVDLKTEEKRERGVLWPLTRWLSGKERGWDALLLASHRSTLHSSTTRISPLVYTSKGPDSPSLHRYWHLYGHESGDWGHRTSIGWNLYSSSRGENHSHRSVLFGLTGNRTTPTRKSQWLLPFYYHNRKTSEGATDDGTLLVLPFYYQSVAEGGKTVTRSIVPPFFTKHTNKNTDQTRTSILLGLYERETGPGRSSLSILPVWHQSRDASGASELKASVLYYSRVAGSEREVRGSWSKDGYWGWQLVRNARGKNTRTFSLNPFLFSRHVNKEQDYSSWDALLLTAAGHRSKTSSGFRALGVIRGEKNDRRDFFGVFPLYYSHEEKQRELKRYEWSQLFNLLYRGEDQTHTRWSALTPYFVSFTDAKKGPDYDFRILHKGIEFRRRGKAREVAVRPFFTYENDPDNGYDYLSLLEILYRSEKKGPGQPTKRRLFLFIPLP